MNRTKKVISDAFLQLLEEKPYEKITVHDIVERCQVNRNTFYYHFSDIPALAEYTIREWSDEVIRNHYEFGSPMSCIMPIVTECKRHQTACLNLYQSAHRDAFMRFLNEVSVHVVRSYVEHAAEEFEIPGQDQEWLIHFFKCVLLGILLDWFDQEMSYDLIEFCEKICDSFAESARSIILKHAEKLS